MSTRQAPQTFDEWRERTYGPPRRNDQVDDHVLHACWDAAIASQQAEIERLNAEKQQKQLAIDNLKGNLIRYEEAKNQRDYFEHEHAKASNRIARYEAVMEAARALIEVNLRAALAALEDSK